MRYRVDADQSPVDPMVVGWFAEQGVDTERTQIVEYDSEERRIEAQVVRLDEDGKLIYTQYNSAELHTVTFDDVPTAPPEILERMQRPKRSVDIAIQDVPAGSITDALIAIERARDQGVYDAEQIERLDPLVKGLRRAANRR